MVQIKNPLSGGGGGGSTDIVNGIIEQYKAASGTIDANTFVEFVNEQTPGVGAPVTALEGLSTGIVHGTTAVSLDDAHVLLTYTTPSSGVYGVICTVSGASISLGTPTQIDSSTSVGTYMCSIKGNENYAVIIYTGSSKLYGVVCSVSGDTITVGTKATIASGTNVGSWSPSIAEVDGQIVVLQNRMTNNYLYSAIVWRSEGTSTTLNSGTALAIASTYNAGINPSICEISNLYGACFYRYQSSSSSNPRLYGAIIAAGSDHSISLLSTGVSLSTTDSRFSVVGSASVLSGMALVAYYLAGNYYAKVFSFLNDGLDEQYSGSLAGGTWHIGKIDDDTIIGSSYSSSTSALDIYKYHLTESAINRGQNVTINGVANADYRNVMSSGLSNDISAVIYQDTSGNLDIAATDVSDSLWVKYSITRIDGLTATSCTETTPGNVWVLDTSSGSE